MSRLQGRGRLGDPSQTAMALFDVFIGQKTGTVHDILEEKNIIDEHIPSGYTDKLQLLDLSVNKSAKCYLREKFSTWYVEEMKQ